MKGDLIKAIVILPGTALVYVPGAILWLSAGSRGAMAPPGAGEPGFWIGIVLAVAGFAMAVWTVHLFVTAGAGTPAPWAPPKKLVVRGPYRYVRNPMLLAVSTMLAAESFLFGSWYLAVWTAFFILLNAVYFASIEEPELEKRFGESYRLYKVTRNGLPHRVRRSISTVLLTTYAPVVRFVVRSCPLLACRKNLPPIGGAGFQFGRVLIDVISMA